MLTSTPSEAGGVRRTNRRGAPALPRRGYSTAEFATMLGILPESIRTSVWRHGHYAGIKPIKLAGARNARLVWPVAEVDGLFDRGAAA